MLRGVRHDRGPLEARRVEGRPDRSDLAVDHGARGDDVGTGPSLAHRGLGEPDEGAVVVDRPVGPDRAAMTVVRVLAQASVRDRHDRQLERSDPAEGVLDDPVIHRCSGTERVLGLR